jgi:hypothetical protein
MSLAIFGFYDLPPNIERESQIVSGEANIGRAA